MAKPDPFDLNHLTDLHREEFVKFELWMSDELTEYLIRAHNLDPGYTTVVVDMDENEPLASMSGNEIKIRLNGRFYMPLHDKQGVELKIPPEEWVETAQAWFDENDIQVEMNEDPKDLIMFTAFLAAIVLPEGLSDEEPMSDEGGGEEPMGESDEGAGDDEPIGEDEEPIDETGDEPEGDEGEEAGGEPPGEDEEGLKEFEKSLGL